MASDIILKRDQIEAVTPNRSSFAIATSETSDPDIRMSPNSASLRLGGGGGDFSEGDLRLTDTDDQVRIHASGGGGSFDIRSTRVLMEGDSGTLKLGAKGLKVGDPGVDATDIELTPNSAALRLGGGGGDYSEGDLRLTDTDDQVRIHASAGEGAFDLETTRILFHGGSGNGEIKLFGEGSQDQVRIAAKGEGDNQRSVLVMNDGHPETGPKTVLGGDGRLALRRTYSEPTRFGRSRRTGPSIRLEGREGRVLVGGAGTSGVLDVQDADETTIATIGGEDAGEMELRAQGTESVRLRVETTEDDTEPRGGVVSVHDDSGNESGALRGSDGELKLGYSSRETVDVGDEPVVVSSGTNGRILLHDGSELLGTVAFVTARNGNIEIGTEDPVEQTLFRIDTENEKIKTKYPVEQSL